MVDTRNYNFKEEININGKETHCIILNTSTGEVYCGKATRSDNDKNDYNVGVGLARSRAHIVKCESVINDIDFQLALLYEDIKELSKLRIKYENELDGRLEHIDSY